MPQVIQLAYELLHVVLILWRPYFLNRLYFLRINLYTIFMNVNPRNLPADTPNVHFKGFIFGLYLRILSKARRKLGK